MDHLNRWVSGVKVPGVFDEPDRELSSVICGDAVHGKAADLCEMCLTATRRDESPERINVLGVVASRAGRHSGEAGSMTKGGPAGRAPVHGWRGSPAADIQIVHDTDLQINVTPRMLGVVPRQRSRSERRGETARPESTIKIWLKICAGSAIISSDRKGSAAQAPREEGDWVPFGGEKK